MDAPGPAETPEESPPRLPRDPCGDPLRVQRLSDKASLPYRATAGSAGYDLMSAEAAVLRPHSRRLFKTDLAIDLGVPGDAEGRQRKRYGRIAPRSGLAVRHGIDVAAGVVDEDYRGPLGVVLVNHGELPFEVQVGDRIAQLILELIDVPVVQEVASLDATNRGSNGFGSTGTR
tara:strand:- start:1626 stop:2147 length:522 start_codon:yes stop_codon:yes gene_type:complete